MATEIENKITITNGPKEFDFETYFLIPEDLNPEQRNEWLYEHYGCKWFCKADAIYSGEHKDNCYVSANGTLGKALYTISSMLPEATFKLEYYHPEFKGETVFKNGEVLKDEEHEISYEETY